MDVAEPLMRSAADLLQPGDLIGRYQLLCPIARGGMGVVWAARQTGRLGLPGLVAIKIALYCGNRTQDCLFDEAQVASSIDHPNVCKIFELGQDNETLFIAMEWVHGVSLAYLLKAMPQRRLDYRIAAQLLAQAASGLHAAHELRDDDGVTLDVVHRDATPQNLLLASTGDLKVVDFGIAKARNQLHQPTQTGELKGKLSYLSPEQIRGKATDRRSDVFSLGCVLYVATTGRSPFNDGAAATTIVKIMKGEYAVPSVLREDYPEQLEQIVCRALMSEPDDRFQSADEFRLALEEYLNESSRPVSRDEIAALIQERCGKMIEESRSKIRAAQRQFDSQHASLRQGSPDSGVHSSGMYPSADPSRFASEEEKAGPTVPSPPPDGYDVGPEIELSSMGGKRSRRAALAVVVGVALFLSVGLAALGSRDSTAPSAIETDAARTERGSSVAAPKPAPAQIAVIVDAEPPTAVLTIDDGPALKVPHSLKITPDSRLRVLRFRAPGHEDVVESVVFDRTQSFLFKLSRSQPNEVSAVSARRQGRASPPQRVLATNAQGPAPSAAQPTPSSANPGGWSTQVVERANPQPIDERDPFSQ